MFDLTGYLVRSNLEYVCLDNEQTSHARGKKS